MEFSFKKDEKILQISHSTPNNAKYSSPEIQNDVIEAIASVVRKSILAKLHSSDTGLFTLKCDETRDKSGVELLSVVLRFVDKDVVPQEKLLGLY